MHMIEQNDSKPTIRIFALATFLNDFGSDIIYPIWPLFVRSFLGANMAVLGFIDGLGDAIVSISQAISGYLSDRIQRRKVFIWLGYLFGSMSRIGYAISSVWPHLIPFRILDRAGKIRSAPRDAIIADLSTHENRGRNFGLLRAMDNLGAVCGVLICIIFFRFLGYQRLFFIAAVPSMIGVWLILSLIKEHRKQEATVYTGIKLSSLDSNFRLFLVLSALFALGSFSYSFLLIFAKEFGFRSTTIPILYLAFTAVASAFSLPFGRLSDKIGRKKVMVISYLLWGIVCILFIFLRGHLAIIATFFIYGLHKAALEPVQRTFVAELAPVEHRASSLGGFQMVIGLCALPASLVAGLLWDKISILTPFYFSLGLTAVAVILLLLVKRR